MKMLNLSTRFIPLFFSVLGLFLLNCDIQALVANALPTSTLTPTPNTIATRVAEEQTIAVRLTATAFALRPTDTQTPTSTRTPSVTIRLGNLQAIFLGQDGGRYAGRQCASGDAPDNVHIHLSGVRTDVRVTSYRIEDRAGGGLWAIPCNPISNWIIFAKPVADQVDLFFKPFRDAPDGTEYLITIGYADGTSEQTSVIGKRVKP